MMVRLFAALALAFPLSAVATPIHVMTFDDLGGERVYVEDGITATAGAFMGARGGGAVLMRYGPNTTSIDFVMDTMFVPVSLDIRPGGSQYCADGPYTTPQLGPPESCRNSTWDDPIPYIWMSGFRDGARVASLGMYLPMAQLWDTLSLADFGPIDLLRIEMKNYFDLGMTGACHGELCGSLGIDNVKLASVPEPGTLSLLAVGLVGLVVRRRRRRSITA